jgi:superfamily II DNA or RNA helicase
MMPMVDTAPILSASLMIPKSALTAGEQEELRRQLTFRKKANNRYGFGDVDSTIFLYDDSGDWFRVPRAYGLSAMRRLRSLCGRDFIDRTSPGTEIEMTFNEELQSQKPKLKAEQDRLVDEVVRKFKSGITGGILYAPCGCHAAGELVLMADGTRKKVEDVKVGDLLMGSTGSRRVLELHRGRQQMVRVVPNKGEPFVVNLGHILTVMWSVSDGARRDGELIDIPISEWILSSKNFKRHTVLYRALVYEFKNDYTDADRPIPAYQLGVLIGDGTLKRSPGITTADKEIVEVAEAIATSYSDLKVRKDASGDRCPTYRITSNKSSGRHDRNGLVNDLRKLSLWGTTAHTKFIPAPYKYGPFEDRLKILAGLIDTDGSRTCGCYEFSSASKQLADDVVFVSRSLGFAAYRKQKIINGQTYWKVMISGDCSLIPVKLARKVCPPRKINKNVQRVGIRSTTILPEADYYGFVVDGDHRYLMGDFTLTHNTGKTVMACKIAAKLGVTTLILAHKEFLVEQWRDRISLWLNIPKEEIGIVQQNRCEYHGRRIVVAMIQSLVEREYEAGLYKWPGLVIADETHRHGAELWHKSAMKFSSKYRLGLTATPDRKDGMWPIVRYNFGEILARSTGEATNPTIYAVRFRPGLNVRQYCWVKMVGFGEYRVKKVYLGKLVTLLAENPKRNRMITDIIMKAVREGRKVLLLTDRLSQVRTLKKMIAEKDKTVTVGRYVGGMSEKARDVAAQCQVILATFQMAQEGLDIPEVDVGILATPHSDVEQAIGRTLRHMVNKKDPVVVDIVDDEPHLCLPFFGRRERLFASKGWPVRYIS